uniref:Uncharacterized protein n=1 Tax=viral metagenome TaxID=1070528 RepID=A0A6C0KDE3_9ZZZZ
MSSFTATMDSFLDSDLDNESDSEVDFDSYTLSRQRQNAILRHLFRILFDPVPDDDSDANDSDADDSDWENSDDESEPVTPKISSR